MMSSLIGSEIHSHKPVNINLRERVERLNKAVCVCARKMITPLNSVFTQIML